MKPNASAVSTRRFAPSFAPRGAKTELQETANAWTSVPPQTSPPAFDSGTPESTAWLSNGNVEVILVTPASSAPAVRDHLERRARRLQQGERRARVRQHRAAARVERDGAAVAARERGHRDALERRVDRRAHALSGAALGPCDHAGAREQDPGGESAETVVEDALEAAGPDLGGRRHAEL